MAIPNGQSFNDSELSRGFHLLTESSHTVKVNIPSVPPQQAHLYPRLAGSNWTCYLCQPCIILGRSSTVTTPQKRSRKNMVHVDLGDSKAISRRHCEIRFSPRRDRWELYVYGRNGVKINHVVKKPKDGPAVLKPSALIEIDKTKFVFILPNYFIKPIKNQSEEGTDFDVNTPNNDEEFNIDIELESAIVRLFASQTALSTKDLLDKLKETYDKSIDKENVLHLLVLSQKFELAPASASVSFSDSDTVTWIYIPEKDNNSQEPSQEKTDDSQSSNTKTLDREKSNLSLPPISLSKLFIDDADWSMGPDQFDLDDSQEVELSIPAEPTTSLSPIVSVVPRPPPESFSGLSIESIYSMWTQSQSNAIISDGENEERPRKRTKMNNNDINEDLIEERDIYKQARTSII